MISIRQKSGVPNGIGLTVLAAVNFSSFSRATSQQSQRVDRDQKRDAAIEIAADHRSGGCFVLNQLELPVFCSSKAMMKFFMT